MGRVARAPHDPERGTSESTGEGQHLYAGVVLEGRERDDLVLDRRGSSSTDSDGSNHLKDGT